MIETCSAIQAHQLFVYKLVRQCDEDLDERAAWDIARKVRGDGRVVLRFKKDKWIELLGDWGDIIYEEINWKHCNLEARRDT